MQEDRRHSLPGHLRFLPREDPARLLRAGRSEGCEGRGGERIHKIRRGRGHFREPPLSTPELWQRNTVDVIIGNSTHIMFLLEMKMSTSIQILEFVKDVFLD